MGRFIHVNFVGRFIHVNFVGRFIHVNFVGRFIHVKICGKIYLWKFIHVKFVVKTKLIADGTEVMDRSFFMYIYVESKTCLETFNAQFPCFVALNAKQDNFFIYLLLPSTNTLATNYFIIAPNFLTLYTFILKLAKKVSSVLTTRIALKLLYTY